MTSAARSTTLHAARRPALLQVPPEDSPADEVLDVLLTGQATAHGLVERYRRLRRRGAGADALCGGVARRLCAELAVQLQIEEELFYPGLREALADPAPVDQAEVEHECMRALSTRLMEMAPDDPLFDARVCVLGELFERHLMREADELHPLLRDAPLDHAALGLALLQRRDDLLADLAEGVGLPDNEAADPVGEPPR